MQGDPTEVTPTVTSKKSGPPSIFEAMRDVYGRPTGCYCVSSFLK